MADETKRITAELEKLKVALGIRDAEMKTSETREKLANDALAAIRKQLESVIAEEAKSRGRLEDLQQQLGDLKLQLTRAQAQVVDLSRAAGQLEGLKQLADRLTLERDNAVKAAETLRATVEQEIAEATRNAIEHARKLFGEEKDALVRERDELRSKLADLTNNFNVEGSLRMPPTELATHFAQVLGKLGEGVRAEGLDANVALTSLDIEARGLLQAPQAGGEPTFVTVAPGTGDAGTLSTLKMSFRLVPRIAAEPGEPD